jgi:NTE family protein
MKQKIALVLSGGGARGNAHIGVIEELERQGFEITSVTGTSMGSLVGGIYADGAMDALKQWMVSLDRRRVFSLVDFTVGRSGVVKGDKVFKAMKEFIPDTLIEDLPIPYAAVAVDLISQGEVVFRQGSLFDAIRASVSIPSILTPVKTKDMLLIDGGVLNNIPVNHAARVDGDLLVAVNVNARVPVYVPDISSEEDEKQKRAYRKKIDEFQAHLARIRPHHPHEKPSQDQYDSYGYFNVVSQTISLAANHMAQMNLKTHCPDLLINVSRDSCGTYDFFKAAELVEAGRHATRQSLESFGKKQA